MQLNSKSDEAYKLASRLAELRGASLTTVVTDALPRVVEEKKRLREKGAMFRDVMAIAAEICMGFERAGVDPPSSNHDWLYDNETGLPI